MSVPVRIEVVDSHTAGEPTRLVLSGGPPLEGNTVAEKAKDFAARFDGWRRAILSEPRGSEVLVGALLLEGKVPGVIFFNNVGLLGMCGHGTIGTVESLRWMGALAPGEVELETPVGTVHCVLADSREVSIRNVPSYRYRHAVPVAGLIGDVAYGGNWFYIAPSPIPLVPGNLKACMELTEQVRQELAAQGITGEDGAEIDHVELYEPSPTPEVDVRNFVLCPGMEFDRSPCGTGTSAKVACMIAEGTLLPGQELVVESLTGGVFRASGELLPSGEVSPTISGRAFVVGRTTLLYDQDDPYRWGLLP